MGHFARRRIYDHRDRFSARAIQALYFCLQRNIIHVYLLVHAAQHQLASLDAAMLFYCPCGLSRNTPLTGSPIPFPGLHLPGIGHLLVVVCGDLLIKSELRDNDSIIAELGGLCPATKIRDELAHS